MNVDSVAQSIFFSRTSTAQMFSSSSSSAQSFKELQSAEDIISQDDTDADGLLAIDETPLTEDMFSAADGDSDGYLTQEELEEYLESGPGTAGGAQALSQMDASSILESEDGDESGTLSFEETTLTEAMFSTADVDEDGELSEEEIENYITTAPGTASIVEDEEEDESIDESSLAEEIMTAADSDGDGYISTEELEAYLTSAQEETTAEAATGAGTPPPGGMPPGGMPGQQDDDDEDTTSINAANAFAISSYENVSANFMTVMGGDPTTTSMNNFFSGFMA